MIFMYKQIVVGLDGDSPWVTTSWLMPIAGDTFATATTLPFTISPEGTGCTTSNISIDFPNSGFTASGLESQGTDSYRCRRLF